MNATHGSSWEIVSLATPPQGGTLTLPNFIGEETDLGWLNHLHEVTQSQNSHLGLCDLRVHAIFTMLHFWHNWRDTFSKCIFVFKTLSNTVSLFLRCFQTQWFICSFIIHSSTNHPSFTSIFWVSGSLLGTRGTKSFALKDLSSLKSYQEALYKHSKFCFTPVVTDARPRLLFQRFWLNGIPVYPKLCSQHEWPHERPAQHRRRSKTSVFTGQDTLILLLVRTPHFSSDESSAKWKWDSGLANHSTECLWWQWLVWRWKRDPDLNP